MEFWAAGRRLVVENADGWEVGMLGRGCSGWDNDDETWTVDLGFRLLGQPRLNAGAVFGSGLGTGFGPGLHGVRIQTGTLALTGG